MRLGRLRSWLKVALAGCCAAALVGAGTTSATSSYFYDVESLSIAITATSPLAEIAEACGLPDVAALSDYELVWGTTGDDQLGKNGSDDRARIVIGMAGDDLLQGNKGDDCLLGGPGDDELKAFDGVDRCVGGPGQDTFSQCEVKGTDGEDDPKGQQKTAVDSDPVTESTEPNAAFIEVEDTGGDFTGGDSAEPKKSVTPINQAGQKPSEGETSAPPADDTSTDEVSDDAETASSSSDSQQDVSEPPVTDGRTDKAPAPPQDQTE